MLTHLRGNMKIVIGLLSTIFFSLGCSLQPPTSSVEGGARRAEDAMNTVGQPLQRRALSDDDAIGLSELESSE